MAVSDKQKQYRNKWDAENMTVLGCKLRKEDADKFRAACKEMDTTPNAVFKEAIKSFMEHPHKSE